MQIVRYLTKFVAYATVEGHRFMADEIRRFRAELSALLTSGEFVRQRGASAWKTP